MVTNQELRQKEDTPTFNRQSMFTPEGKITSRPSRLTEKPNLERQAAFDDFSETIKKADAWLRSIS